MIEPPLPSSDITPIILREDIVVYIGNLPHDLTTAEADKINKVINAYIENPK